MALRTLTPLALGSEATVEFTLPEPLLQITAESKVCWNKREGWGWSVLSLLAL
jgi:hypothetical protein